MYSREMRVIHPVIYLFFGWLPRLASLRLTSGADFQLPVFLPVMKPSRRQRCRWWVVNYTHFPLSKSA